MESVLLENYDIIFPEPLEITTKVPYSEEVEIEIDGIKQNIIATKYERQECKFKITRITKLTRRFESGIYFLDTVGFYNFDPSWGRCYSFYADEDSQVIQLLKEHLPEIFYV
jgi:hypothetical protein